MVRGEMDQERRREGKGDGEVRGILVVKVRELFFFR